MSSRWVQLPTHTAGRTPSPWCGMPPTARSCGGSILPTLSSSSRWEGYSSTQRAVFYVTFNNEVDKYSASGALLWAETIPATFANSMALGPDGSDVVVTGNFLGGSRWVTASFDAATGGSRWSVTAPEGNAARDVVVDSTRVYVTGQGYTDPGTPALAYWLTVVAYDRTTGARLWRTDKKPADGSEAAGLWMAKAPDGSLVVTGQGARGFLDWYMVAFETNGTVRWEAVRDGGLNTDEIPAGVLVLPDGTTVVTGRGGPIHTTRRLIHAGRDGGYSGTGTLLWETFSLLPTVWPTALPNGDVCATGGYDAFTTCWGVSAGVVNPPQPTSVVSRKTHGTAGTFDINLPLAGNAGIECRSGGANSDHQVVFTFLTPVTLSGATVTPEPGMSGTMAGGAEYQSRWKDGNTKSNQRYRCADDCDHLVWSKQRHEHERCYRPYASTCGRHQRQRSRQCIGR